VHLALQEARQKLSLIASKLLNCPSADIVFQEGQVLNQLAPAETIAFVQLAATAYDAGSMPQGIDLGLDFENEYTLPQSPVSFGAHAVAVEVNQDTLAVKILRYVGVHDCGQIINPMIVEGQIQGGIAQGIGQALTEGIAYTDDGQPLTASLMDYPLPRAIQMPALTLDTINTISPTNPLGAKGIGSVSTVPSPAAVTNAVLNALSGTGVRHIDTPLTPEKLWRAVRGHKEG
jgi:carbon-monoxide dehydrogenase large subunit